MSSAVISQFDWAKELEQTVVKSLTTTFGLDFLLLEDKKGGDVDTIHKVQKYQEELKDNKGKTDIYISDDLKGKIANNPEYDSGKYHSHKNYVKNNAKISKSHKEGTLKDGYTGEYISSNVEVNQDHIVSAYEVHNDYAVILSGMKAEDLANRDYNLEPTHYALNKAKQDLSMEEYVKKIPEKISNKQNELSRKSARLEQLKASPDKDINQIQKIEKEIKNAEEYIKQHQKLAEDASKALEKDKQARKKMTKELNWSYYTSSKFFKATASAAHQKGLQMGTRQALGLVLSEVWFELREQVPAIYQRHKVGFDLEKFWVDVQNTLKNIFLRIKSRFKDLLTTFKDSYIGGVLASINETILNAFFITQKMIGKMIREMWNNLVGIIKLIFFNPNNLALGDLLKEAMKLLSLSVAALVGTSLNAYLDTQFNTLKLTNPVIFGNPYVSALCGGLISFVSALVTGILNLGFTYFLEHSAVMQKVWNYLNQIKSKYAKMVDHMKEINLELDRYLMELAKIELNFNVEELTVFANQLCAANSELERSVVLQREVARRNIELPFEAGNADSTRKWLLKLQDNYHNKN